MQQSCWQIGVLGRSLEKIRTLDLQRQKEDRKIKRIFVKKLNIKGRGDRRYGKNVKPATIIVVCQGSFLITRLFRNRLCQKMLFFVAFLCEKFGGDGETFGILKSERVMFLLFV